jgi:hypothetical protein
MSWFSQCILGGSKQVPPCSPWSPCHGCMNFQNSHRFDWHLPLQKYPRLSESWDPEIGPAKLYWNINSWGYTFEHFAIFPAEKKQFINRKNEMTSGNFAGASGSFLHQVMETSWSGPIQRMVLSSGLNLLHWDPGIQAAKSNRKSWGFPQREFFSIGIRASKGKWSLNA